MKENETNILENAIAVEEEKIVKSQQLIEVLNSLDVSKPITEKIWHKVCETSVRNSPEILEALLLTIFPMAKNIRCGANKIEFKIDSFGFELPTTLEDTIKCLMYDSYDVMCRSYDVSSRVNRSYPSRYCSYEEYYQWAKKNSSSIEKFVEVYYNLLKNNASWYTLVKARYRGNNLNKFYAPIYLTWLWFFDYKPKDKNHKHDIAFFENEVNEYNKNILISYIARAEVLKNKIDMWKHFFNVVQPILLGFTENLTYKDGDGSLKENFEIEIKGWIAEYDENSEAFERDLQALLEETHTERKYNNVTK